MSIQLTKRFMINLDTNVFVKMKFLDADIREMRTAIALLVNNGIIPKKFDNYEKQIRKFAQNAGFIIVGYRITRELNSPLVSGKTLYRLMKKFSEKFWLKFQKKSDE